MLLIGRCSLLAVLAVSCALLATGADAAVPPRASVGCVPILASGVGLDHGDGTTDATISIGGIAVGRTSASFTRTEATNKFVSFAGPIIFRSLAGTLTAQTTGRLIIATGDFRTISTSLAGTGLLRGISGQVTLVGQENLATGSTTTGSFTETITGRLCGPRR